MLTIPRETKLNDRGEVSTRENVALACNKHETVNGIVSRAKISIEFFYVRNLESTESYIFIVDDNKIISNVVEHVRSQRRRKSIRKARKVT